MIENCENYGFGTMESEAIRRVIEERDEGMNEEVWVWTLSLY